MLNVISAEDAAKMIHDGDTVLFNGFGSIGFPEKVSVAVGERFQREGAPKDMTMIFGPGQGVWNETRMVEHMCQPGMIRRVIGGHLTPNVRICNQIQNNEIEGYNFSMGVISHLTRASAAGHPGLLTRIGVKTFIDPRYGGGALNDISKEKLVELMTVNGKEYLFYPAIHPNIALIRGTTADPDGNITFEKEAFYSDAYHCALAARANGGKVIVQVERLTAAKADARKVVVPGILVDAVVVDPDQWQSFIEKYNPAYTGEVLTREDEITSLVNHVLQLNIDAGRKRERGIVHQIIARRAAQELSDRAIVNLGIGVPELIPEAAKDLGLRHQLILTLESGCIGGVPSPGINFGIAINPDMVQPMARQFDLYDGGMLDMTFVGAMQVAKSGDVNVSKAGARIIGVGGFTDITQSAKKLSYCFPFSSGGMQAEVVDGKLHILQEGKYFKFCNEIDQVSASAAYSLETGQPVLYITERCVFDLTQDGVRLIEIAPGVSLEEDILAHIPFRPLISEHLKEMDPQLFRF